MSNDSAISTPIFDAIFDARPHMQHPSIQELLPDEHNPAVPAQTPKSYEALMQENVKLRVGIRAAEAAIERMLKEVDLMVVRLKAAGGGK